MKKKVSLLALIVFVIGLFGMGRITKQPPESPHESSEVLTVAVKELKTSGFDYKQSYIGFVQAVQSVDIVPYLAGFLDKVLVQSGKEVAKNEVLFILDQRIPLAKLNEAKEAMMQAKATRDNARSFYERIQKTDAKAISSTELEEAQTKFQAAEADLQQAIATQNQAQTLMDYTVIQAPINGWVGNITATVGEYLSPQGKRLARIISFSPMRLTFGVPLAIESPRFLQEPSTLEVVLSNGQKKYWSDFEVRRNNQANQTTDSVSYFIDVENPQKIFVPDAYIGVNFIFKETGILVDKNWVYLTPTGSEVFVLENGIIEKRKVEIEAAIQNQYWIKSGLKEGDKIIIVPISVAQIGKPAKGVLK